MAESSSSSPEYSRPFSPTSEVGSARDQEQSEIVRTPSRVEELLENVVALQRAAVSGAQIQIPVFNPASPHADAEGWCALVDEYVKVRGLRGLELVTILSAALRGEASEWLIRCRPLEKDWQEIRCEFLSMFVQPIDLLELFGEAVNGRQNVPHGSTLIEEALHSARLALSMIKTRESDEALATLFACHVAASHSVEARRRLQSEIPKTMSGLCVALRGKLGKRPALSRTDQHINPKRPRLSFSAETSTSEPTRKRRFNGICHLCGHVGHKSFECFSKRHMIPHQRREASITCFRCGKSGHISVHCPRKEKSPAVSVKQINVCEKKAYPYGDLKLGTGKIVSFLFDSGSECSLIKETVSLSFDGKHVNDLISLKGIGNSSIMCTSQILAVVNIQNMNFGILFHVVPDDCLYTDVIIGRDLLGYGVTVSVSNRGVVINQELIINTCASFQPTDFSKVSTDVTGDDKNKLISLLEKFKHQFVEGVPTGRVTTGTLEIRLKDPNKVVHRRPYRLSPQEQNIVRHKIDELLEAKVIRPSSSPFSSPMILVKKKNGTDRMCIDFRELNNNTVPLRYPLPLINDQINRLHGAHYFTTLDMASGFYQIPVHKDSIEKTAFVTPQGQYEFLTMPFGLTTAPSVYQRAIDTALGDLRYSIAVAYIDDVLIPSVSISQGLERLELVVQTLVDAGFSFNLKKCKFLKSEVEYLGYLVRSGEVRPNPKKVDALINSPIPKTQTQVRQFLGLASYFRCFIPNFSRIATPLYQLTSSAVKTITWASAHAEARLTLLKCLTTEPVLQIFDPTLPIELHTDASSEGYGAVLLQRRLQKMCAVAYFSKRTTEVESRYHSYELETLAVVKAIKNFKHFLQGRPFTVVTDCNSLKASRNKIELTPRVHRWWAFLQSFDFDVQYREGKRMRHADFFSRNAIAEDKETVASPPISIPKIVQLSDLHKDWLAVEQQRDSETVKIITQWNENKLPVDVAKTYDVRNKMLFRRIERQGKSKWLPIVPKSFIWSVINHVHLELKHLGWEKTLEKLYELYWFPRMAKNVRKFVENCIVCKACKGKTGPSQVALHPIPKVPKPWHTIHVDISGKLTGKSDRKEYAFVIVDGFTKFVLLYRIKTLTGKDAVQCLTRFTHLFGAPARIIADQGKCFTSTEFRVMCSAHNIQLHFIAHNTSRANGQVERYMLTLKNMLTMVELDTSKNWQDNLGEVQLALNSTKHRTTGFSAAELLFGVEIRSLQLNKIILATVADADANLSIADIRSQASNRVEKTANADKARFNAGKARVKPFQMGEFVFARNNERMLTKLDRKYRGPYKIVRVLGNDRYEVAKVNSKGKAGLQKFAHDQLRRVPNGQGDLDCLALSEDNAALESDGTGDQDEPSHYDRITSEREGDVAEATCSYW